MQELLYTKNTGARETFFYWTLECSRIFLGGNTDMNFGEQIKKIRAEKNLTQQKMADMLNVSRQAVSNWENDKNLPDIEMIINMSRAFNMTLDELVFGGKDMNNMTEKLINDGSENRRKNMNLI